jgi:membrane fusion protein (multidrug efflux system)
MEVEIVLADGDLWQRGHITFADASFSSETGTYLVRAELPNTEGALRPGQFVRACACWAPRARARSRCRRKPWCRAARPVCLDGRQGQQG